MTEALPLAPAVPAPEASPYVSFIDCTTGFRTDEVFDADREVVHFDADLEAMVSAASGDSVGGWTVAGVDLDWSRSGVAFRVNGRRRAPRLLHRGGARHHLQPECRRPRHALHQRDQRDAAEPLTLRDMRPTGRRVAPDRNVGGVAGRRGTQRSWRNAS
jgi:hypothetical protein